FEVALFPPPRRGRNRKAQGNALGIRSAPSGRCYSQHPIQFPGRRPGLECRCPFGARFKKRNFKIRKGGKRRNEIGMKAQLVQDQLFTSPVLAYRANRSDFVDGGSRRPRVRRGLGSVPRLLTWGGSEVP